MKLLFLDIDGVLVTRQELMKGLHDDRHHSFNLQAVEWLNLICAKTNCSIVISSTWRFGKSIDTLRNIFDKRGFVYPEKIIGKTPSELDGQRDHEFSRGEEIEVYLNLNVKDYDGNSEHQNYCIVDDDSDMLIHQLPYFVKTEFITGLQQKHYAKILKILNKEYNNEKRKC